MIGAPRFRSDARRRWGRSAAGDLERDEGRLGGHRQRRDPALAAMPFRLSTLAATAPILVGVATP